jgi:hypothetical protein
MPLQPNIALQVQGLQLPDPLAQSGRVAQIQNALQEQRMGEMKIQNALREQRREQDYETVLSGFKPGMSLEERVAALQQRGLGAKGAQYAETQLKLDKTNREAEAARIKAQTDRIGLMGQLLSGISDQSTLDAVRPQIARIPGVTEDDLRMLQTYGDGSTIKRLANASMTAYQRGSLANAQMTAEAGQERARAATSQAATAAAGLELKERGLGIQGRGLDLQRERLEVDRQRLTRDEQRMDLDRRRVELAEENQRRQGDPTYQRMIEQARAAGTAAGKSDQAAVETLPKVITTAEMMLSNIDAMIGKPEIKDPKTGKVTQAATRPHPGFEMTVGATLLPGARFVPGSPAADFQARFDQLKGESFLQAYETLKGGGQITNIEGEKGTQAITRMSLAQSEKEFIAAARELQGIIKKGVERAQSRVSSAESVAGGPRSAAPRGKAGEDSNAPAQVKSDADYDKLPSGALFTGPDGVLRRKP